METHACVPEEQRIDQAPGKDLKLPRELKIDKAVYLTDKKTKTCWYLPRNPE
jgi:hypothetical protein